ncbi:hypothetical protein RDI58_007502 [Solanum bulbocastanum]|uniref:Endonuclease/exonuclease/phosphatase domain-containing protein n=1 Tax=Solanum bulbocastanum TaxID=147425 RepID=A0AAN8YHR8_SOLBU
MNRISYARVLVEVDISQPLVEIVTLDTHHGSFQQDVTYNWRPKFYSDCLNFGHATKDYWDKPQDLPAEEFKEAPKRKRRSRIRHKTIPKWKVRPAIKTDEAPSLAPTTHDIANKDQAGPSHRATGDRAASISVLLSIVYAMNEQSQREALWQEFQGLGANIQSPWILSGDFNNVLAVEERIDLLVTQAEIARFKKMVNTLQLTSLRTKGCFFTWCNKRQATSRVYSKIDWVFGNLEWLQQFSHVESEFLGPRVLYHSLAIIQCQQMITLHPNPFKLYMTVMEHPSSKVILQ